MSKQKSRKRKYWHRPVEIIFKFGSWVECDKCRITLHSWNECKNRCKYVS